MANGRDRAAAAGAWAAAANRPVVRRLAACLATAGYTEANLTRLLGQPIRLGVAGLTEVLKRRLDGDGRRRTLFRLFWLGVPISSASAQAALAPLLLDELTSAGLVTSEDGRVTAVVGLSPYRSLLFAHDPGRRVSEHPSDFVASVSANSSIFERLTIRRNVRTGLDLGTGCGVQALLAARHVEAVTAVDVNERAIDYATLNVAINDVDNVRVRHGSWFEPVGDDRFDLVMANLPFVISPETAFVYRDGGLPRDELARSVVSSVPDHLEEGGVAHIFCDWVITRDGDWRAPVETWIAQRGCDALLLLHGRHDPLSYAARWNHPLDEEDPACFAESLGRWLEYYASEGIEEIADGVVVLRRRSAGRNFVRGIEVPGAPARPAGEHVRRLFSGYDLVRSLTDVTDVLELNLALPATATLDCRWATVGSRMMPGEAHIVLRDSAGFSVATTPETADVLRRCNGRLPLHVLVAASAGEHGQVYEALATRVAAEATRLVGLGMLVERGDS